MRRLFGFTIVAFVLITGFTVTAQDKKLTLKDIVYMNPKIIPASVNQIQWRGNTDLFSFVDGDILRGGHAKKVEREDILKLENLNFHLKVKNIDTLANFPKTDWINQDVFMFRHDYSIFLYDLTENELRKENAYSPDAENINIEKNGFMVAYTIENNLFVAMDGNQVQVTHFEDKGIVCGQAVHRREFGIHKGIFWSPDGDRLAFYKKDETMVTDYPLVDLTKRIAEHKPIKYPMAGMTSEEVKLGVYNVETKETVFLNTGGPADHYLTNVTWDPFGNYLYVSILNRDQNFLQLNQYDAATGLFVKTLFKEQHEKYIEPELPMTFLNDHSDQFVWFSEKDGYQHMYLYSTNGKLISQLTSGKWVVTDFYGFDEKDRYAYFAGNRENPIRQNVYSVKLSNGEITRLSSRDGTNHALFNESKKYFINQLSSTEIARQYTVINKRGKTEQELLTDKAPLAEYNLGEMTIFTLKNDKGDDLYCRLIKPADFDSAKKYPVIIYVYGGPHSQLVRDTWLGGARLFLYYLSQQGYVVFTLDNRGTANRGFDFESKIFRNLGKYEVKDQMAGVKYLKSLTFVDSERIGVNGWSYGGFMTISMLLEHPEDFKVGVAGGPVTDWKYYEVMYGERYMDTPESNPEGYEYSSLIEKAHKLDDRLLIIHDTNDETVMWQNSLNFLKKCIEEGIQLDYFVYPGHKHNVRGSERMHLYDKITGYFNDFL